MSILSFFLEALHGRPAIDHAVHLAGLLAHGMALQITMMHSAEW